MSDQDRQLPVASSAYSAEDAYYGQDFETGEPAQGGHLGRMIWNAARDRLAWVVVCAVVLGVAAGVAAYFSHKPLYLAESKFMIKPLIHVVKDSTPWTDTPPMWKDYIGLQHTLITNPSVVERAQNSKVWQDVATKHQVSPSFGKDLKVGLAGGSLFVISNAHTDPEAAQASVNALMNTFVDVFNERELQQEDKLLDNLYKYKLKLEAEALRLKQQQGNITNQRAATEVELQYASKMKELQRISQMMSDTDLQLHMLSPVTDPEALAKMTELDIAARDPVMGQIINDLRAVERQISQGEPFYGPQHKVITRLVKQRDNLRDQIKQRADLYRMGMVEQTSLGGDSNAITQQIEQLKALQSQLIKTYDNLQVEVTALGEQLQNVREVDAEIAGLQSEKDSIEQRIDAILESRPLAGRIEVISEARLPSGPFNSKKRIQMTSLAGFAGAFVGAGMVVLIGIFDGSLRRASDAQQELPQVRMLGVLPTLPANLNDPEQAELASHTVHHIRTLLQIDHGESCRVYATTGASAGSGKSSLTLALGLSFANSGAKTLLIDADYIGGGLSHRILGEHVSGRGIADACAGLSLDECVIPAPGVRNLHVLTLGEAGPNDAATLSPKALNRIVTAARERYEVVLIDCGPVLGSLEASMSVAEADGVVMVVSRGDQKSAVTRSVDHILSLNARLEGVVFNHALDHDVERSNYGSMASQARSQGPKAAPVFDRVKSDRYGPLGLAVAAYGGVEPAGVGLGAAETRTGAA